MEGSKSVGTRRMHGICGIKWLMQTPVNNPGRSSHCRLVAIGLVRKARKLLTTADVTRIVRTAGSISGAAVVREKSLFVHVFK